MIYAQKQRENGENMNQSFDTIWETIHETNAWGKYPSEVVIRFIARNYYQSDRKTIRILDFGCGAGSNTWYLARENFDVYAFDGSESAIRKVKERFLEEGLHADLRVRDALNLDYENDFFDCVVDNVAIYANRLPYIIKMYEKIYQMLREGGKIFSVSFSKNTTGYRMGREIEQDTFVDITCGSLQGRGTVHFFSVDELTDLLHKIGFKNLIADQMRYTDRGNVVENIMIQAEK